MLPKVPVHSASMTSPSPSLCDYMHEHSPVTSWFHPWSASMPPTGKSTHFNPRSYDTVAPWAYEHMPAYNPLEHYHCNFNSLSPLEREMWNSKHDVNSLLHNGHRHSFSSDLNLHPSRPGSLLEHYSLLNPIRIDTNGNCWLNCYFDLRSYKPEEVKVELNTKERFISVEAAHEVDEQKEHYVKRQYSRKVFIPADFDIDLSKLKLDACLNHEGLLCIEAALPKLTHEQAKAMNKFTVAHPASSFHIPVKTV